MRKVRLRAVNIVIANRLLPKRIVYLEPYRMMTAVKRAMAKVKTIIMGFVSRKSAV